jgi:hypothetical protein
LGEKLSFNLQAENLFIYISKHAKFIGTLNFFVVFTFDPEHFTLKGDIKNNLTIDFLALDMEY